MISNETDIFKLKRDHATGNLLNMTYKLTIRGKIGIFVVHNSRLICDSNVYNGDTGDIICELKGHHLRNPLITGISVNKKKFICTSVGSCAIKIFTWNGNEYEGDRMKYLR